MKILKIALGGLIFIPGSAGGKLHELAMASQGIVKPGREIIPHDLNVIFFIANGR